MKAKVPPGSFDQFHGSSLSLSCHQYYVCIQAAEVLHILYLAPPYRNEHGVHVFSNDTAPACATSDHSYSIISILCSEAIGMSGSGAFRVRASQWSAIHVTTVHVGLAML
jgi:hypothetical protein